MEADLLLRTEIRRLDVDPLDLQAQQKIEELMTEAAVSENMEHALECFPDSFGRVTML
jgi:DNA damage-inducible protein 1